MKRSSLLLFSLLVATASYAQPYRTLTLPSGRDRVHVPGTHIEVTDRLDRSPVAAWSRNEYARRLAAGFIPPASKNIVAYAIGDEADFRLITNMTTETWGSRRFVLKAQSVPADPAQVRIWIDKAELENGHVTDAIVASLFEAMVRTTPAASINPEKGIIANNHDIFGLPPDVDGDGAVDVLLYDIEEGSADPEDCCTLGYVTSANLSAENEKDILYLDSNEGIVGRPIEILLQTASHEYQHWIHYRNDLGEFTFVNEGLAEWSEIMNGYPGREIDYINTPDEHRVWLLWWEGSQPDYQRANHFTTYFAQRTDAQTTGLIARSTLANGSPARGADAYRRALVTSSGAPTLEELIADFHVASYLNDASVSSDYAHTLRPGLGAASTVSYDARLQTETPNTVASLSGGAVQYLTWEYADNLQVTLYVPSSDPNTPGQNDEAAARLRVRAILYGTDGSVRVQDVTPGLTPTTFTGSHKNVTLVVAHIDPSEEACLGGTCGQIDVAYSAAWDAGETFTQQTIAYDDGQANQYVLMGQGVEYATSFSKSPNSIPSKVYLPLYHLSQFGEQGGLPATEPRDYTLVFRSVTTTGKPGTEILALDLTDSRQLTSPANQISYLDVDLSPWRAQLSALPENFFVGFRDRGTDNNEIIMVTSSYATENVSFFKSGVSWQRIWDVELTGGAFLTGQSVPVRLEVLTPVATDDDELPGRFDLAQNYPNPFSSATTIDYAIARAADVTLEVYDVMGRRVAVLVDDFQTAGSHSVTLNTEAWPSGVYFCTLRSDGFRATKKMLLVR